MGFLKRSGMTTIALLVLVLQLLSACGPSGGSAPSNDPPATQGAPAAPAAVDELRIAINSEGDTLDPAHFSLVTSYAIATNIYSALVRYKPGTLELEADLAKDWDVSADGKTWTFNLRDGIKWQKGYGEMTAADVVWSFQRILNKETGSRWVRELADIADITAPDARTVVFTLKQPNAAFLHSIAAFRQGFITKKEAVAKHGQDFGRNPVGTGAFQLEKWVPNTEVVLTANPDYYLGAPALKKVTFVIIPDETVRMLALEKGEVDIAMGLTNPEIRKTITANQSLDVSEVAAPSLHAINLNTRIKPLDNPKVRQALYMAIDRDVIAEVLMGGLAEVAYSELAPALLGHSSNVPRYKYDPAAAKALLAEAGHPQGFETTLYWLNTTNKEILDTLQSNWKAIGVNVKVNMVDSATWVQSMGKGEAPMIWFAATRSDPNVFYSTFFHSGAFPPGLNASFYTGVDKLIEAGATDIVPEKRAETYAKIQQQIMTDLPMLPLYWPKHAHPAWTYVKGWGGRQNYDAWLFPVSISK